MVSDDIVNIIRLSEGILIGTGSDVLQHHMEIRGIGIIDIRNIFGVRGIRLQKRLEVEVHLEDWEESKDYERVGLDERKVDYLDIKIPIVYLPIFPGKNVTVIIETIALNELLKIYGFHSAQEFNERLIQKIQTSADVKDYLLYDLE